MIFHDWPFLQGSTAGRLPVASLTVHLLHLPRQLRHLQKADIAVWGVSALEMDDNLGRQSLSHLPAPGEQRSLCKDKASSSSTNCCTEFNHWHSPKPSDNQFCSQVCKLLLFRRLGNSLIPLETFSATSPTPPGDTDPPSVLLSVLAGKCLAMPAFFPDELSMINRPDKESPSVWAL